MKDNKKGYRFVVLCRQEQYVRIPCEWYKEGVCGQDGRPCDFILVGEENEHKSRRHQRSRA